MPVNCIYLKNLSFVATLGVIPDKVFELWEKTNSGLERNHWLTLGPRRAEEYMKIRAYCYQTEPHIQVYALHVDLPGTPYHLRKVAINSDDYLYAVAENPGQGPFWIFKCGSERCFTPAPGIYENASLWTAPRGAAIRQVKVYPKEAGLLSSDKTDYLVSRGGEKANLSMEIHEVGIDELVSC